MGIELQIKKGRRSKMRQRMIKFLLSLILISLLISCKRDDLYYSTGGSAMLQFNIDWKPSLLEPNGVSVFSYDHQSGDLVRSIDISSNPNRIELAHSTGKYDFLVFNDTEYELDNIRFDGIENIKTFRISAGATSKPIFRHLSKTSGVVYAMETDDVAKKIVPKLEITQQDVEYFLSKPAVGDYTVSKSIDVTPSRITERIYIEILVKNITSAAGAPRTHLTNMAAAYLPGLDQKHEKLLTHEFVLNNRQMLSSDSKDGKISKQLVSFGPHTNETGLINKHQLIMHYVLIDGKDHVVELDVTHLIESSHDGVQHVHKIRAEIELPVAIGDGGGGPFNPDVEDWKNVEIELPI